MPSLLDIAKPLVGAGTKLVTTAAGQADGLVKRVRGGGGDSDPDHVRDLNDPTLKSKVETVLYRVPGVSRSKVNVTVADGVVTVHGEVRNQAQMQTVETAVRGVPEVRGYESQLHLPKTAAPSTPNAGQRQATRRKPAARTKAAAKGRSERVNRDKTAAATAKAEPTPAQRAETGEGRTPAPFGSTDPDPGSSS
jgi:BON domain